MNGILATAILSITLAGAAFPSYAQVPPSQVPPWADSTGPVKPGSVRVTLPSPDRDKWDVQVTNNGATRVFRCKPLACAVEQAVFVVYQKSPTTRPDPKALERYATVEVPKGLRAAAAARSVMSDQQEKVDTITSKVMTIKDYPGVFNESKVTKGKAAPVFHVTNIIFAGNLMIRIASSSPDREAANNTLKDFIGVMVIVEGPPLPSHPTPPRDNATRVQEL